MRKIGSVLYAVLAIVLLTGCSASRATMEKKVREETKAAKEDRIVFSASSGSREFYIVCKSTTAILVFATNDFLYSEVQKVSILDPNEVACVRK